MKDGLPGIATNIGEEAVPVFNLQLVCQLLSNREDVDEQLTIFLRHMIHRGNVPLGYEQDVVRSLWVNILKGYYLVILVYDGTRYLRSEERRVGKECRSRWS